MSESPPVTLEWHNKIKERLKVMYDTKGTKFRDNPEVWAFIFPILLYAKEEERRIAKDILKKGSSDEDLKERYL